MSTKRTGIWLLLIVVPIGALIALIGGVWGYQVGTATTLHPDAAHVPSVSASSPPPTWAAAVEQGRQLARASVVEQNLPGLSVAVGVGRAIVWAEGFGWADLGSDALDFTGQLELGDAVTRNGRQTNVTPETRFRIVGVSMAPTSAAVGLLVERDRLNLDAEVQTYVPAFPEKPWPITLRQLMAHQAGIRNDAGDEAPIMTRCAQTIEGFQLDDFASRPLLFEPGTRAQYSTYGWVVVSAAIEAAADEPFFTFMRSNVFEPLGMRGTRPESWTEPIPNRATPYFPRLAANPRYGPDLARQGDHSCFAGGGAFLSTPSDLVRFGMAIATGGFLKPDTVQMLETPQRLTSGEATPYGLGWRVETTSLGGQPTRLVRQEDRRSVGGSTTFLIFPERGIVVAVMSNITFADTSALATSLAEAFAKGETPGQISLPIG
jgi:serine beta-lactamase-like protein LACTB